MTLDDFEALLGYSFKNKELLRESLTHPSTTKRRQDRDYERLEFLGDRVLGLVVAEMLFTTFPGENEGHIAKRHAALVRKEACIEVANVLRLGDMVHVAGADNDPTSAESMLADACEALIGAMYLDGGLEPPRLLIRTHWEPLIQRAKRPPQDAKSALQEWAQARGMNRPVYSLVDSGGPDHNPFFRIEVCLQGIHPACAEASTKKKAEQLAAELLLKEMKVW